MKINIETYCSDRYNEILVEYGKVLSRFGLSEKADGSAEIYIDCLGDIFSLHKEIENFINDSDKSLHYFGLMIKSHDDDTIYLEIKDNYDWKYNMVKNVNRSEILRLF